MQHCFHHSIFYIIKILSSLHYSFYLYSFLFFSSLYLLLNKDYFITPSSIYAILFSSLHLLFMQYCFHHSSFCLHSILFITPASICTVFFSSIQHIFKLRVILINPISIGANNYFLHSNFYLHNELV